MLRGNYVLEREGFRDELSSCAEDGQLVEGRRETSLRLSSGASLALAVTAN